MYLPWIHVRFFLIRISQNIASYNRDCMKIKFTLETLHFTFILFTKSYFHIHLPWILLHSRICSQHFWLRLQHRLHCSDKCCPHRGCYSLGLQIKCTFLSQKCILMQLYVFLEHHLLFNSCFIRQLTFTFISCKSWSTVTFIADSLGCIRNTRCTVLTRVAFTGAGSHYV